MNTINDIADAVHANAIEKGFHDFNEPIKHFVEFQINNLHDEVSELHEALRAGKFLQPCDKAELMQKFGLEPLNCAEEEYADIIIRSLDQCRRLGIDIQRAIEIKHAFNKTRPYRHGGKLS